MKVTLLLVVAALAVASVAARCPNSCSGHGNCGRDDKCTCWANWQGNDCSMRTCGYDNAWGLNKYDPHYYAECSNRGICDRSTGECDCFDCFEGRACTRSSCPNDCSGHGKCRYISDQSNSATYVGWDAEKIQVCVCDGGFYGPDCSQRYCPMGDDPMTICDDDKGVDTRTDYDIQRISISFHNILAMETPIDQYIVDANTDEFVIKFTDPHGEVWTTQRIEDAFSWAGRFNNSNLPQSDLATDAERGALYVDAADRVRDALKALPNFVIPDVDVQPVTTHEEHNHTRRWDVSFTSPRNSGPQETLQCFVTGCQSAGCQPMYKQMRYVKSNAFAPLFDSALSEANAANVQLTADTIFDATTYTYTDYHASQLDYRVAVIVTNNSSNTEVDGDDADSALNNAYEYQAAVVKIGDSGKVDWATENYPAAGPDMTAQGFGGYASEILQFKGEYVRYFQESFTDGTYATGRPTGRDSGTFVPEFAGPSSAYASSTFSRIPVEYDHVPVSDGVFVSFSSRRPTPGIYMWLVSLARCDVDANPAAHGSLHPNRENVQCSNRGECDTGTGVCACHEGYYGDNCQSQTILV